MKRRITDEFIQEQVVWAHRSNNPILLAASIQLLAERLEEKQKQKEGSKWAH